MNRDSRFTTPGLPLCAVCGSRADTCVLCGTCRRCVEDCRVGCRNQGIDLGPYETGPPNKGEST